jgi:hypothetical protein
MDMGYLSSFMPALKGLGYDTPDRGIQDATARRLTIAIGEWADAHTQSRLTQCDLGSEIVLVGRRPGFDWTIQRLDGGLR